MAANEASAPPAYGSSTTADQVATDNDAQVRGRVVLITGANGGLGFETARALALHGAKVVMTCRSQGKAEETAAAIRQQVPDADLVPMGLDLSSLASVREFATAFLAKNLPVHVLINNAGVMACPKDKTQDGFELQFGVNHLGHFLLTHLLLDKLKASGTPERPARVVNVSSAANYVFPPSSGILFDDLSGDANYNQWERYGQSKLAGILHAKELQRRMDAEGAPVWGLSIHPGVVMDTQLYRYRSMWSSIQMLLFPRCYVLMSQFRSIRQGAATEVFAAIDPRALKGEYYFDCQPERVQVHPTVSDPAVAKRLWDVSEELVGIRRNVAA